MSRLPPERTEPESIEQPDGRAGTSAVGDEAATRETSPVLSIVIPAYNEAENLIERLVTLDEYLSNEVPDTQVAIVDDGSDDATPKLVNEFCLTHSRFALIRSPHRGKAGAVATGVMAADGKYILFMDMDMATSIKHVGEFVEVLDAGEADIVAASREAPGAVRLDAPWLRRLLGRGFNVLVQMLLLPGVTDTQCGFKAFTRAAGA